MDVIPPHPPLIPLSIPLRMLQQRSLLSRNMESDAQEAVPTAFVGLDKNAPILLRFEKIGQFGAC